MTALFLLYLANTMNVNVFILLLLILEPVLKKYYSSICLYRIWLILLIGLLLPVRVNILKPLFHLEPPLLSDSISTYSEAVRITNTNPSTDISSMIYSPEPSSLAAARSNLFFSGLLEALQQELSGILQKGYFLFRLLWLLGCSIFLLLHLITFLRYRSRINRYLFPVTQEDILTEFQRCYIAVCRKKIVTKQGHHNAFSPRLCLCPVISSPMTIGILRPKVLLPDKAYDNSELNLLIRHELVHVRRKDVLLKLILLITLSLNWFNPLCYILSKHMDIWCEASCDEIVLRQASKSECISYGRLLLKCAEVQKSQLFSYFINLNGGKANMKQRLLLILNRNKKSTGIILLVLFLGIITTTVFITADHRIKSAVGKKTEALDPSDSATDTAKPVITSAAKEQAQTAVPTTAPSDLSTTDTTVKEPEADAPDAVPAENTEASVNTESALLAEASANSEALPFAEASANSEALPSAEASTGLVMDAKDAVQMRDEVVAIALAAESTPYVWGGADLKEGVDSSGLVQAVYKELGYELPRTSREQCSESTEVSLEELLPGDLVFYDDRSGTINHVGIYIGDGQIIHAKNKRDGVSASNTDYRTPKCAGRIIEN